MPRFRPSGLLASAALALAAASAIDGGRASAAITCTFGNLSGCYVPEANLLFSNFTFSGDGADNNDTIQIQAISPTFYSISFAAGGVGGNFDDTAKLNFTISSINSHQLLNAAANSTMAPSTPFTFSYASTDLTTSPITTSGSASSYVPFTAGKSTANFVLSWSAGTNVAQSTALYINLNPPVPAPLPFAGAAAAFLASRKVRRRIRANQA